MDKTRGGDIELFSIALLLNTDIWVSTTEMKNSWMVYSGKGASLMEIMISPPANDAGSYYIQHAGNHYEPILELNIITKITKKNNYKPQKLITCKYTYTNFIKQIIQKYYNYSLL